MSIVTIIRDYIEVLNNVYDSVSGNITFLQFIQSSLIFFLESIRLFLMYVLTFQWLRDISYLPIIVPQITVSVIKENYFLENNLGNFFTFLESPVYNNNKFFIGFLNSFFLSLPISCSQFITIRRLFIQGIPAAFASSFGTILGQSVFLVSIWLGLRFLIIPWFSIEPLSYVLGIFLILTIVFDMVHERAIKRIQLSDTSTLVKIFFLNFLLSWTEQSCILQYLGNLTFTAEPTVLDIFSSNSPIESFFIHLSYLFGIVFGSIFFSILLGFIFIKFAEFYQNITNTTTSRFINRINFILLSTIIGLSCTSIPYYSLDYLLLGPLGFVSEDKTFQNTIFNSTYFPYPSDRTESFINVDISRFDRGQYLKNEPYKTFEELNYQGEYGVNTRTNQQPSTSYAATYDTGKTKNFIAKFFKNLENKNLNRSKTIKENKNTISNNVSNIDVGLSTPQYFILNQRFIIDYIREDETPFRLFEEFKNTFNKDFFRQDPKTNLEYTLLNKYYSNPVYKTLLLSDIDLFNKRQQKSQILTAEQENNLFEKRLQLSNYYNSLRAYMYLPYSEEFDEIFHNSKSYTNRVYNQQYKGTLKILRRLFSLTLDEEQNEDKKPVLKFDKALFKNDVNNSNPLLHEEVKVQTSIQTPFIEETNPIPLYAGWDEQLRKLVITNRLMPRYFAGFEMKIPSKTEILDYPSLNKMIKGSKRIEFSSWPLSKSLLQKSKQESKIPYIVFFESKTDPENEKFSNYFSTQDPEQLWNYETFPINLKVVFEQDSFIPQNRGGLIWPGTSNLQFNFKEITMKHFKEMTMKK